MKKKLLIISLLATFVSPVFAQTQGFYIGANIGQSEIDTGFEALDVVFPLPDVYTESSDNSDTGYSLNAGYNFNQFIAIDASYIDFGEASHSVTGEDVQGVVYTSIHGFTVGAVGSLPLNEKFKLFGKAGIIFWDGEDNYFETKPDLDFYSEEKYSANDNDIYFGVGAAYILGRTELSLDYTFYRIDVLDVDLLSIGMKFNF